MLDELGAAVRATGSRVLRCREEGLVDGVWDGAQFKAKADLIADRHLREGLRRICDIPIVSEEDAASQTSPRPWAYWLIDPIDGTASFAQGFAGFVCQAAYIENDVARFAAVHAPALDQLYLGALHAGATLNGEPLRTRRAAAHDLTLVDNYPQPRGIADRLFRELPCVRYIESGSIGLKICLVARGAADLFVKDVTVRDWDVAPPALVLTEAGGALRRFDGRDFEYLGDFHKPGLIAASSVELLNSVGAFLAGQRTTS